MFADLRYPLNFQPAMRAYFPGNEMPSSVNERRTKESGRWAHFVVARTRGPQVLPPESAAEAGTSSVVSHTESVEHEIPNTMPGKIATLADRTVTRTSCL
jgi:hypothetical protein